MSDVDHLPLLRLMQLVSPALPVGAYAYSQGLETAVSRGWVNTEEETKLWISGLLRHNLALVDLPVLFRLYAAFSRADDAAVYHWSGFLAACRETRELRQEDQHLGQALARLLTDLGIESAHRWRRAATASFAVSFALAATMWRIPARAAASGYAFAWLENQVASAVKLVPLGQTAGQRILSAVQQDIPALIAEAQRFDDDEIGFSAPAFAVGSAWHETEYTRLFQS